MRVLKALFLLFLLLLFLMAAIPTNNAGANDNRGPVPTPTGDGAVGWRNDVAYSDCHQVETNGYHFSGKQFSMEQNHLYGMN